MLWVLLALVLMVLSARVRATQWGRGAPKVLLKSDGVGVSRGLKPTALPYHYESSPTYKGNFGEIRPMGELCRRRPNMESLRLHSCLAGSALEQTTFEQFYCLPFLCKLHIFFCQNLEFEKCTIANAIAILRFGEKDFVESLVEKA